LIIENRSSDETLAVACSEISRLSIKSTVVQNDENYGFGGSMKRAFIYALDNGYTHLVTLHGDDQADPRDLVGTLSAPGLGDDLTIGARFHPESGLSGYSRVRVAGNRILNVAFGVVAKRRVHDMIAGLNLFRLSFYEARGFLKFPDDLTFDAHLLLFSIDNGASIQYVPVTWREEDQISNAKVVEQALTILRLLGHYVVNRSLVFEKDRSKCGADFLYPGRVVAEHGAIPTVSTSPESGPVPTVKCGSPPGGVT
jgi:glycosyltransferase involved in cell wall biosynthesis